MSDIFISYASADRPRAQLLAQTLEGHGWSIFWDRAIPTGKTWRDTIGKELNDSRCVIVLWSKASIESDWVQDEADDAKKRRVLVPILIEDVRPPMGFRSIQTAHLVDRDVTEPTQAFHGLIADIAALIGPPTKEPEKQGRQAEAEIKHKEEKRKRKAEAQSKASREALGDNATGSRRWLWVLDGALWAGILLLRLPFVLFGERIVRDDVWALLFICIVFFSVWLGISGWWRSHRK